MSGGAGRTGARVAVKMEVAPFYGEEGLELLPDFVQLPGFGGGPEAAEESALAGKKPPPQPPRDLVGAASPGVTLPPAGPFSLRPGGASVHRLLPEAPEVGPGVLQPLLKLPAAADLEQLLIQAGSPGLAGPASPTAGGPSSAAGGPFLYRPPAQQQPQPAAVTQEQEGFADGFVKALADLHKQNQLLGVPPAPLSPGQPCCAASRQDPPAVYTTLSGFNPGSPSAAGAFFPPAAVARLPAAGSAGRALEEPQTVPEAPVVGVPPPPPPPPALSSGESPPPPPPSSLSPLDAESQERLKAERKRLRNRIAASKCRRRKLERIARLEEKVKALKGQNAELAATASLLRAQVTQLQGRVRSHLSSGCHINAAAAAPPQASSSAGAAGEGPPEPEASAC